MKTVNRFCRDCYQTTPHEVRHLDGLAYECTVCKKSGKSIWIQGSEKKEPSAPRRLEKEDKITLEVVEK